MAKRKKNKKGRGSVAEETQSNLGADDTGVSDAAAEATSPDAQVSDGEATPEGEASASVAAGAEVSEQSQPSEGVASDDAASSEIPTSEAAEVVGENAETSDEVADESSDAESDAASDAESDAASDAESDEASDEQSGESSEGWDEGPVAEGDETSGDGAVADAVDEDAVTRAVGDGVVAEAGEDEGPHLVDLEAAREEAAPGEGDAVEPAGDADAAAEPSVWGDEAPTNPRVNESGIAEEDAKIWESTGESSEAAPSAEGEGDEAKPLDIPRMQSIIESLLFASDRALSMGDFKRLLNERDTKKIQAALEELAEHRRESGIHVVHLATGWHLRTNHENGDWVSKLLAGKPMRLSRAMMETLAIVAYRQPVTRPEIDDIRGVDCGPVLKTLLDRGLIRIIGKKEDVGRPMLYGTTPEFLRVFNLRDLSDLPTLREFYELSEDQQATVAAKHGPGPEGAPGEAAPGEAAPGEAGAGEAAPDGAAAATGAPTSKKEPPKLSFVSRQDLPPEEDDADPLLDELEDATKAATKALGQPTEPTPETPEETPAGEPEKQEPPSES